MNNDSFARFLTVARLEWRSHLRGPLFWILMVLIAGSTVSINPSALIPSGDAAVGGVRPFFNSPFAFATLFALTGFLLYTFFSALITGSSILREDAARISDLVHATPLTAGEYVFGKFAGALAVLSTALGLHLLMTILFFQFGPVSDPALRGPFEISNYLVPALAFAVPQIWLLAALALAVGEVSRRTLLVAAVPMTLFLSEIFFLWTWRPAWLDPRIDRLLMVLDPSGLRWILGSLFEVDRGVAYYNTASVPWDSTFLLNRLLMLGLPVLALLWAVRHCRRRLAGKTQPSLARWTRWMPARFRPQPPVIMPSQGADPGSGGTVSPTPRSPLADLRMSRSTPGFVHSAWQIARAELRELRSQPSLYLFSGLLAMWMWEQGRGRLGPFDTPLLATAGDLAVSGYGLISLFVLLVLLFYTVESIHRDRASQLDAMIYSAPLRTSALLIGKGLSQGVVALVLIVVGTLASLALLLLQPGARMDLAPFALVWGALLLPSCALWIAFVTGAMAVLRNRWAVYGLGFTTLVGTALLDQRGFTTWVTNWTLWGTLRWSDLGLFDLNGHALWLNRLTVVGSVALLAAFAIGAFTRTESDAARRLHRLRPGRLVRRGLRLAPWALLPLLTGGLLAYEVRNGFQGPAAEARARDYWRHNVATWQNAPVPTLTHIDLDLDLEPAARRLQVAGTFHLVNDDEGPMARLPLTVGPAFEDIEWTLDGAPAEADRRSDLHVLTPPTALAPGGTLEVGFSYRTTVPRGLTRNGRGVNEFILPSGVLLSSGGRQFLPVPGFVEGVGVGKGNRTAPKRLPADFWRAKLPPADGGAGAFTTHLRITAPRDYTVNTVGEKIAETTTGDHTTAEWRSTQPVRHFNLVAGRWEVQRKGGAAIFYHPKHHQNVPAMLDTLAAARQRYSTWFAPYPWAELRINEFPNQNSRAQGFPSNINFSEGIGFLAREDSRNQLAQVVTAHEAAHQWWGNLLTPGEGPGAGVLIEGMANYSTLLLLEAERGDAARQEFARRLEARYTGDRRIDSEPPLVGIVDDSSRQGRTLIDDKGAWVMWMLDRHLGREKTLAGLKEFIRIYRETDDYPALHDLIETLRPHAPDPAAFQAFVDQWFFDVVLPEFRIADPRVERIGERWRVSATVENLGSGTVTVELAALGESDSNAQEDRVAVRTTPEDPQRITWDLPFEPKGIVVDPDVQILQLGRERARVNL